MRQFFGENEEEDGDAATSISPSESVSQVGPSTEPPKQADNLLADEGDGNTDDDRERAEEFMAMRKQRRDYKRKWGGRQSSSRSPQRPRTLRNGIRPPPFAWPSAIWPCGYRGSRPARCRPGHRSPSLVLASLRRQSPPPLGRRQSLSAWTPSKATVSPRILLMSRSTLIIFTIPGTQSTRRSWSSRLARRINSFAKGLSSK